MAGPKVIHVDDIDLTKPNSASTNQKGMIPATLRVTPSVIRLNPAIRDRVKSGHRESGRRRDCFTLPTCSFARRGVAR